MAISTWPFAVFLGIATVIVLTPHEQPQSSSPQSVPSYLTPSPAAPPAVKEENTTPTPPAPQPEPKPEPQAESKETAKNGIEKPVTRKTEVPRSAAKSQPRDPSTIKFSRNTIPEDITNPRDQEPLHLVGESKIIKPLVKILARALSQHLMYPRVAADFNLRGVVVVGFVLHPEGYVTEARVMQSSGAGVLDDAARDAVGAMSPVGDVHEYLPDAEFMAIGIIFG